MARARFWLAYGGLALAILLLVPAFAPLSGSMDAFADDLANGTFRPFGPTGSPKVSKSFTGNLGGLTGDSAGNFLPGATQMPTKWLMDRDGRGGHVVIDYVFDPALGAMKRLKAFDKVGEDGETLEARDLSLVRLEREPGVEYSRLIHGSFAVRFHPNVPTPIYSVHPKNVVQDYDTDPPIPGGVRFWRDGTDTVYAVADHDGIVTLNLTYFTDPAYYALRTPLGLRASDYPLALRPVVPADLREDAEVVLARAGVEDEGNVGEVLQKLTTYFRAFQEGPIPEPDEVDSTYLALALGGNGCCRHRAFAFMVTAQAVGIPTRVVVNEAHAFVEVALPDARWHQINLGGCGTYAINNPEEKRSFFEQAEDPRAEADPTDGRTGPLVQSFTEITESPASVSKGETYVVRGTVTGPDGRGVPGAIVDVFLNETKDTPGKRAGAGRTEADGSYAVEARVPKELGARSYQLVARSSHGAMGNVRYDESWSDPPLDVTSPTRFAFPQLRAAVGFPANVTGRLLDVDGNAVRDAPLDWSVGGEAQPPLRTDSRGGFVARVNFTSIGDALVTFSYAGDDYHGASVGNATVKVERGAILLPGEAARVDRGHEGALSGQIAVAGVPLGGHEVLVTLTHPNLTRLVVEGAGVTDARGRFSANVTPAATLPTGAYDARYEVPSLGLEATTLVLVSQRPVLVVQAPDEVSPGEGFDVVARILGDDGRPLAGAILSLHVDGNATAYRRHVADETGVASFAIPHDAFPRGDHQLRVVFEGDPDHSPAVATALVTLARPWYELVPAWAWALLAALVLIVAPLALALRPEGPLRRRWALARARRPARRSVVLAFPDFLGLPPVSEPGGRVRVAVGIQDREGHARPGALLLSWPGGRARGRARKGTQALFDVPTPDAGDLALVARARGLARLWTRPARAVLPVASYREAVERGFVALRARAALDASATPEDLVRTLRPRVGAAHADSLDEVRRRFEVADFSEEGVDDSFYRSFARARQDVEERLAREEAPRADG